jgi:protein-disulfide isomerase
MTDDFVHRLKDLVSDADWSRGPADALALVEYADYQCSSCQAAFPVIERVLERMGSQVRFVVRHFPVVSIHPLADGAALAAEAAGRQGKFWEMHRRLMESRGALGELNLVAYARGLGLDIGRFQRDMADESLAAKIRKQKIQGLRSGVNGTPTVYIDAVRYDGQIDEAGLRAAIETELSKDRS